MEAILWGLFITSVMSLTVILLAGRAISSKPTRSMTALELGWGWFDSIYTTLYGQKKEIFAPFLLTMFLFILLANWIGLLPILPAIVYRELPVVIPPTGSLSVTISLAVISSVYIHYWGIKSGGLKRWVEHFFNNPLKGMGKVAIGGILIGAFVGILEISSEVVKVVSLSFRLFGNIYAGQVVISEIEHLQMWLLPVPFLLLESLIGLIQAGVFTLLTAAFLALFVHAEE